MVYQDMDQRYWLNDNALVHTEPWRRVAAHALINNDRHAFEAACAGRDMMLYLLPMDNIPKNALYWTLLRAIDYGELRRLKWLLELIRDVNRPLVSVYGSGANITYNALQYTVYAMYYHSQTAKFFGDPVLEMVLKAGAKVQNLTIERGESLLYFMLKHGSAAEPCFQRLITAGARFSKEELLRSALSLSFHYPDRDVVTILRAVLPFYPPACLDSALSNSVFSYWLRMTELVPKCQALGLLMGAGLRLSPERRQAISPQILEYMATHSTPLRDQRTLAFQESGHIRALPPDIQHLIAQMASHGESWARGVGSIYND